MVSWLVVGIGDIARRRVLPAILEQPQSLLAGIVTSHPDHAAAYNVPAWDNLTDALASCEANAVYIATPVFLHAEQTIECLRAGRHVLCEKPMALNYDDAAAMQRASEQSRRTLGIAYYRRMYPKIERARQLLEQGAIGRPVIAQAAAHTWFNPLESSRPWLADPLKAGGGPLRDVACHRIDLMTYLFGKPLRASAEMSTLVQPIPVEDNVTLTIEYEGGMRGVVDARWHSRVTRDEFRIRGTEGEISLSPLNGPDIVYPNGSEQLPAHENLHYPCIEDFVNCVEHEILPRAYAQSALATEWVMDQVSRERRRQE